MRKSLNSDIFWLVVVFAIFGKMCSGNSSSTNEPPPISTINKIQPQSQVQKIKYVSADVVNIRVSPNGEIIGKKKLGESVNVYETKSNWSRISSESESSAWISANYLCEGNSCFSKKVETTDIRTESSGYHTYSDCRCSVVDYCVGPRGGHFCITSGGNKRYIRR